MTDVMNGRLVLADPSSGLTALSLEGGELNMFGKYTRIRTTQRDSFSVINDAPTELKVVEESNSLNRFINGAIGLVVGVALGAVAVALIAAAGAATGGAAVPFLLGAIPFMVASTAAICTTVQVNENDKYTGYKRSPVEFSNILVNNVMTAYTAGGDDCRSAGSGPRRSFLCGNECYRELWDILLYKKSSACYSKNWYWNTCNSQGCVYHIRYQ
ncbi:MAG: hypothetical protein K2G55_20755 [Lachnospiraceae bacterium]|nr:hypothetical protein [Lachnospiraceae bacterium]